MGMFYDISVFPSYGRRAATVAWAVAPSIRDAEFYVYRSVDGTGDYELLNDDPVFGRTFTDADLSVPNKLQTPYYRLLAVKDGKEYESPPVAVFDKVGRKAYGVAHSIIRAKFIQARADGIPVLYYPLVRNGLTNESLDPDTGQRVVATCPAGGDAGSGEGGSSPDYGTFYAGGYCRPFVTYMRILEEPKQRQNILDVGMMDASVINVELPAFPFPRTDDMIVDVATDRRWKIGDTIQSYLVKGVVPVGHEARVSLQSHNDPCYQVPVPDNYMELLRRMTCLERI